MVRSGLQQDVINMYRQGVKNAFSKPHEARPAFLLHLRYNFRVPKLAKRDYTAIEHQLRRMSHTLEMLSSNSVTRLNVSGDMVDWWVKEIGQRRMASSAASSSSSAPAHSLPSESDANRNPQPPAKPSGGPGEKQEKGGKAKQPESAGGEAEQKIGGGKMPGPGGT